MFSSPSEKGGQICGVKQTNLQLLRSKKPTNQIVHPVNPFRSYTNSKYRRENRVFCTSVSKSNPPVHPVKAKNQNRKDRIVPVTREAYNSPSIEISLDYYSVLKARKVNSAEILKRSYENLLTHVPDNGYSKETLNSREAILRQAADIMLDSEKRRAYDQSLTNNEVPTISVAGRHFSGALALLQEAGEIAQVVELGARWLNENGSSASCEDVALSVAKAYCDLASYTLSSGESVALCCEELQAALDILRACNVAPDLQVEISIALKDLRPQFILEQLALPDEPEYTERRVKGLSELKVLLWETDEDGKLSPSLQDRQNFLQMARTHLTAAQQIEVFESCPRDVEISIEELYDSAMAYIAEGYRAKWPQLIVKAEKALQKIQLESLTSEIGGSDVSVELGLCALLLGATDRAMTQLGLKPGTTKVPDRDVVAFVKDKSPSEDDLLPGVCALAEVWLKDTIIPNYKEINMMTSSLGEWFQSPSVSVYLTLWEPGRDLNILSAVRFSTSIARGVTSAISRSFERLGNAFRKPVLMVSNDTESVGRLKLPKVNIPKLSQNSNNIQRVSNLASFTNDTEVEARQGPELSRSESINGTVENEAYEKNDDTYLANQWWPEDEELTTRRRSKKSSAKASFFQTFWKTLAIGSTVILAVALGKWVVHEAKPDLKPAISAAMTKVVDDIKDLLEQDTGHGTIDVSMAEDLVRRWHVAKSEALGSTHNVDQLAEVLQGAMLRQYKERAKAVQNDGWHWEYTLMDLSIDTVSLDKDGKHAVIEATIKEKAEFIDSGRKADSYSTSYTVQYDLIMKKQGWKISAARVVYQSS